MTRGEGRRPQDKGAFGSVDQAAQSGRWRAHVLRAGGQTRAPLQGADDVHDQARRASVAIHGQTDRLTSGPGGARCRRPTAGARVAMLTLGTYARAWLTQRDLKDRTREHYRGCWTAHICPPARAAADALHHRRRHPGVVRRAGQVHADAAGALLRAAAHDHGHRRQADRKIGDQPVRDPRRGLRQAGVQIRPATHRRAGQAGRRPCPSGIRRWWLLASWCALRFGELTELRRGDIDLEDGVIRVRRAVVRAAGEGFTVTSPKSEAGPGMSTCRRTCYPRCAITSWITLHRDADSLLFAATWRAPGAVHAVQALLQGPRRRRATGSAVPRPAPHRRGARGISRRPPSRN